MRVDIPFKAMWRAKMLSGIKTATTRSKRYGKKGDVFEAFGADFMITDVLDLELGRIADSFYREEGCPTPLAFRHIWTQIHPRRRFQSGDRRYIHFFERYPGMEGLAS